MHKGTRERAVSWQIRENKYKQHFMTRNASTQLWSRPSNPGGTINLMARLGLHGSFKETKAVKLWAWCFSVHRPTNCQPAVSCFQMISAEFVGGFFLLAYMVLREYSLPKQNDKTGAELSGYPLAIRIPLNSTQTTPKSMLPGTAEASCKEPQLRSGLTGPGFSDLSNCTSQIVGRKKRWDRTSPTVKFGHWQHRNVINHTALSPWVWWSKVHQGNIMACSQKTLSVWQLFYLNQDVSWLFFSWENTGFFPSKTLTAI